MFTFELVGVHDFPSGIVNLRLKIFHPCDDGFEHVKKVFDKNG